MDGTQLRDARLQSAWTQHDMAVRLGVTQAYLSMVERGARPVSPELALRVAEVFDMPATALPLGTYECGSRDELYFKSALGALGYPGFAYLREGRRLNPAALLMEAIDSEDLDARVVEALPWLAAAFPAMDWGWLVLHAKVHDRQNRLAFVVSLARQLAESRGDFQLADKLADILSVLEKSRLAREDTLCKESMTTAERHWLKSHRTQLAAHWNLLSDLTLEQVDYGLL
jgi:transcriptional regulator with XRE-family HTH domain